MNSTVKVIPITSLSYGNSNPSRDNSLVFDIKENPKDLALVLSFVHEGVRGYGEAMAVCQRKPETPVYRIPDYEGQDKKVKSGGVTYVLPAQEISKAIKATWAKDNCKYERVAGERRANAIIFANVLRKQLGLEAITEITVADYGDITEEEKLILCIEENTRKMVGVLALTTLELLVNAKHLFGIDPNMGPKELGRQLNVKWGQAQVIHSLCKLDYKFPSARIVERTRNGEIPWLAQRGKEVYDDLLKKQIIAVPPPEGSSPDDIERHNMRLYETEIVDVIVEKGAELSKNAPKVAPKPKIADEILNPANCKLVQFALSCFLFNNLSELGKLALVTGKINEAVDSIMTQFGIQFPEFKKPEVKQ